MNFFAKFSRKKKVEFQYERCLVKQMMVNVGKFANLFNIDSTFFF